MSRIPHLQSISSNARLKRHVYLSSSLIHHPNSSVMKEQPPQASKATT